MRYIDSQDISPGMVVEESIQQGSYMILKKGSVLTNRACKRIREMGIQGIYINDCPDFIVTPIISPEIRNEAYSALIKNEYLTSIRIAKDIAAHMIEYKSHIRDSLSHEEIKTYMHHTQQHEISVCIYSLCLAITAGLPAKTIYDTATAAMLHDIGKNVLPKSTLQKTEPLTASEKEMIKKHPYIGYQTLLMLPQLSKEAKRSVLHHHENIDGSGYYGVKGHNLSESAKIIRISDVYDAMRSNRKYREKVYTREEIFNHLDANKGIWFDPYYVELFEQLMPPEHKPAGTKC